MIDPYMFVMQLVKKIGGPLLAFVNIIDPWLSTIFALVVAVKVFQWLFIKNWDYELYKAARDGKLSDLQEAILNKANLEAKRGELTALMIAAIKGHRIVLSELLSLGAETESRDEDGRTALIIATQRGDCEVVQLLLARDADPNAKNFEGWTSLIIAAYLGNAEIVDLLITRCADMKWRTKSGLSALTAAVDQYHKSSDRFDIIRTLLKNGAKVDSRTLTGWTSLMKASFGGFTNVMKLLIEFEADVDAVSNNGFTSLMAACQNGWIDAVKLLIEHNVNINMETKDGSTALIAACNGGYHWIVELLLDHGADITARYKRGSTALMATTYNGHKDSAFLLIDRGIDIHACNEDGWNALMVAVDRGCYGILCRLLELDADVNVTSKIGWTPLMSACQHNLFDIAEELIKHGADTNSQQPGNGWSPITISASLGSVDMIQLLLKNNANVNRSVNPEAILSAPSLSEKIFCQFPSANNPLLLATVGGYDKIVKILLKYGANPNIVTVTNKTALIFAVKLGYGEIARSLYLGGAKISFRDFGYSAVKFTWLMMRLKLTKTNERNHTNDVIQSNAEIIDDSDNQPKEKKKTGAYLRAKSNEVSSADLDSTTKTQTTDDRTNRIKND